MKESIHVLLDKAPSLRIMVAGDLMLDRYLWGKVERISPEAPVPIVEVTHEESRPGGAANVALNLHSLGVEVVMCGVVGVDESGAELISFGQKLGFNTASTIRSELRRTTVKVRVMGNQQQVLRVDKEDRFELTEGERADLRKQFLRELETCDGLVLQDYDKGLFSESLIREMIQAATTLGIPVIVDPKFRNFFVYNDCSIFKPNLKELNEGLGLRLERDDIAGIGRAVARLRERMPHRGTLITLSENGMLWVDESGGLYHVPAHRREIVDVSGAGDTVVSVIAVCIAAGISPLEAVRLANLAGGLVCEEVGVVPIMPQSLRIEADRLAKLSA